MKTVKLQLIPEAFARHEQTLVEIGALSASTFRFESGVLGLRLRSDLGELVLLPFQGQQIWSASMGGRELTMKSVCDMPYAGVPFLQTFGGFLQHCGVEGMGSPGPQDTHPLHGELPNAPYQYAWLEIGEDARGPFMTLSGQYHHRAVFGSNYVAEPRVVLRQGSSVFAVTFAVTNLKQTPMDLMYLAHINFRTVLNGELFYSAIPSVESVRVRREIPPHIIPKPRYADTLRALALDPSRHHRITPDLAADPEIAMFIDYLADGDGWAHTMQLHPDGSADYVAHRPKELPRATRWISRTPDHDAIAIVEPGTAEPEGYLAERAKGNIVSLPGGKTFRAEMRVGVVLPQRVERMLQAIDDIIRPNKDADSSI